VRRESFGKRYQRQFHHGRINSGRTALHFATFLQFGLTLLSFGRDERLTSIFLINAAFTLFFFVAWIAAEDHPLGACVAALLVFGPLAILEQALRYDLVHLVESVIILVLLSYAVKSARALRRLQSPAPQG
jgi:hypothetical protein